MVLHTLLAALVLALASGGVHASGSTPVTVNATVVPVCKFITRTGTIAIRNTGTSGSNIDPSSATTATGTVNVTYRCSNRTVPTFSIPATATLTCSACTGTPTMAATITSTNSGAGGGFTVNRTLRLTGSITQAVFQNARAGAYTGTMTVSVTP